MRILAIVSLVFLIIQYALALLTAISEQGKTPVLQWGVGMKKGKDGTDIPVGKKIVTAEMRELSETEKRKMFAWFALSSIPAIVFEIVYLIKDQL